MRRRLPALLIALLLPGAGLAAGDPRACRDIADPDARLACYDRALGVEAAASERSVRESPRGANGRRENNDPGDAIAAEAAATGSERSSATDSAATPGADAPTRITDIRTTSLGRQRFHLATGEVWERTRLDSVSTLAVGDAVVIGDTLFGSHFLREQAGRKRSVKVRRVE